jgi:phenylpyruvate tautomerase PptA (4-oxalocrotonate tautomerase family)
MPIIKVWCLPKNIPEERLKILCEAIIAAVESIPELGFAGKNDVTVLFPSDRMEWGLGEEIIAEVGIFNKPERTEEVRAKLAEKIGQLLHGYFPSAKIECFIHPLERSSGFWKIDPRPKTT